MAKRASSVLPFPRFIRPEQVEIGDTVRVKVKTVQGVTPIREGVVAERDYRGSERVLLTAEGGELFAWHPSHGGPQVTLLARNEAEPETLFSAKEWDFTNG